MADFDLAIIGGGINGAGIARDAAGRGLRVLLVEQNDLASGTSSASTKLIHGGLRYLEHGAFGLVRKALSSARCCCRSRRISSGRCGSCCRSVPRMRSARMLQARPLDLRPPRRTQDFAADTQARSHPRRRRPGAAARFSLGVRIFRLLGGRCAAGGAQRARRGRTRRDDPHAHAHDQCRAQRHLALHACTATAAARR